MNASHPIVITGILPYPITCVIEVTLHDHYILHCETLEEASREQLHLFAKFGRQVQSVVEDEFIRRFNEKHNGA